MGLQGTVGQISNSEEIVFEMGKHNQLKMPRSGLEPAPDASGNTAIVENGNALSDALLAPSPLQTALDALAKLTPKQRAALVAMLSEAGG